MCKVNTVRSNLDLHCMHKIAFRHLLGKCLLAYGGSTTCYCVLYIKLR